MTWVPPLALMASLPLHPVIVHVPLGVAVIMPLVAAGVTWAWLTGRLGRPAWLVVLGLQAVLVGGAVVALLTGQGQEERAETVVAEAAIHAHEDAADLFLWGGVAVLVLAAAVWLIKKDALRRALAVATTVGTVIVLVLAIRTGHAGGQLVYEYGAASAYVTGSPTGEGGGQPAGAASHHGDGDD